MPSATATACDPSPAATRALVVGAGFGGLSAALRLLARGHRVDILERHPDLGGRARSLTLDGIVFDAGPTVITAPFLFEELFSAFEERLSDYVKLLPVDPFYRMEFADGSHFNYCATLEGNLEEIERLSPGASDNYHAFLAACQTMYQRGFVELGRKPFTRVTDMLQVVPDLVRLRADRSIYQFVARFFEDERLRRAFSVPSLLVGGNPFRTSSLYALIHALERKDGVWYVQGGTGALIQAMADLFKRHGGRLYCSQPVARLAMKDNRVIGAHCETGDYFPADLVVSNADPLYVYQKWIARSTVEKALDLHRHRLKQSMGLFVLYFTTDRAYPELEHHTIIFGETFREILTQIFDLHQVPEDLSLYLHRPGATDPGMAAPGRDAFYVLAPVPNLQGDQDWERLTPVLQEQIISILEKRVMPDLRQQLRASHCLSPVYFHEQLNSPYGSGFSIAPVLTQSAGLRFHNRSPRYPNLYFAGAGTHPGAGVPGVVSSAAVVEQLVAEDFPGPAVIPLSAEAHLP